MKNALCEMFGIEVPIFAFSHCRDVVVEVSKAGGLGVFGMGRENPEHVREHLRWIDEHIQGKPYGIDVLMPSSFEQVDKTKDDFELPKEQLDFVRKMLDDAGIPPLPVADAQQALRENLKSVNFLPEESARMIDIALEHPIKLIVNGLGTPPKAIIDLAHSRGVKIAALAGSVKHAVRHKEAGCDFVMAVGTEAGGHTGKISSMVLWPAVVDAVAPMPVLGGGGVGRGRQLAAALALGCEGVWCGSVWLTTVQSEVLPEIKARMFAASHEDAVHTKNFTGKTARVLNSRYIEAWDKPGAPQALKAPQQRYLWEGEVRRRLERAHAAEYLAYPVGQIVGDMKEETSVRNIVHDMISELLESKERLDRIIE